MCWALDKIDPLQQLEAHFAAAGINVGRPRACHVGYHSKCNFARAAGRCRRSIRHVAFLRAQTTSEAGMHPEVGDPGVRHLRFKYEVFVE